MHQKRAPPNCLHHLNQWLLCSFRSSGQNLRANPSSSFTPYIKLVRESCWPCLQNRSLILPLLTSPSCTASSNLWACVTTTSRRWLVTLASLLPPGTCSLAYTQQPGQSCAVWDHVPLLLSTCRWFLISLGLKAVHSGQAVLDLHLTHPSPCSLCSV